VLCHYAEEGIEYVPVDAAKRSQSSLTAVQLQTVVAEAQKIEAYFGTPQDIEFAIDDQDNFYVLQAREITSLFPIDEFDQDGKLRAYLCASSVMLGMKEPFTPLGFDWMSQMFPTIINVMTAQKEPLDNSFVKPAANRIYVDMTYLLSRPFIGRQFGKVFAGNDLPLEDTLNAMLDQHGKQFARQGIKFKMPWGIFKYAFSMIGTFRAVSKLASDELYDEMKALGEALYEESKAEAKRLQTAAEKLAFGQKLVVDAFKLSQTQGLYCTAFVNLPKLEKKVQKWYGDRFDTTPLNHAFPDCITVELGIALNHLAKFFDEEGIEPTADHPKMVAFLEKFGHRSTIELDFGVPRWSENPAYILNLVKSYMVDQMYARNIADHHQKVQQANQLIEDIYQALKVDKGERRARKFRQQITAARIAAGMREYPKFDIVHILALARKIVLEVGREYVEEGLLDQPEDIFFLHLGDIKSKQGLRAAVRENRADYAKEMARTSIPRIVLNTGETYYSAQKIDPNSKVLQGMPLSPGSYEGQIRVVFDPNNSRLQEGEIMVTESTNPAWTPLFITAKGLIMEYGGPVSHGGIVAREYGIPAVVGISSATKVLQDGQRVRINGETGTVEILS
jgi:pyruvate,water dikinase